MPFPNQVNVQPAPAVAGDFASTNPRATVDAGPGGLVAGPSGVTVGRFAWLSYTSADTDNAPAQVNNFATASVLAPGAPAGIVHREQQALITTFLSEAGMVIPAGFPVTVFNAGDFWVKNDGSTQATIGQYAFANFADGRVLFANGSQSAIGTGTVSGTTASITGSIGPQTASFTGSIAGNILTVAALASGTVTVGGTISSSGGTGAAATGTQIISQLSGTPGGAGTYALNIPEQTVTGATFSQTAGLMTVTAVTGTIGLGMLLTASTGTNPIVGTYVSAFGTGSGGTGTYLVNASQTIAGSQTITGQGNIQTKFIATSSGAAGELVKISSWLYG
jgi:hypothetical protein